MVFPVLQMLILLFDLCFDSALLLWSQERSRIYPIKQIFLSVDLQVELRMLRRSQKPGMDKPDYPRGLFSKGTNKMELLMMARAQVGQADRNSSILEPGMNLTEARQVKPPMFLEWGSHAGPQRDLQGSSFRSNQPT